MHVHVSAYGRMRSSFFPSDVQVKLLQHALRRAAQYVSTLCAELDEHNMQSEARSSLAARMASRLGATKTSLAACRIRSRLCMYVYALCVCVCVCQ